MANSIYFGFNPPFLTPAQIMPLQTDERLIKNDLLQLLLTVPGERSFRPDYGTNLKSTLFEPNDPQTQNNIKNSILRAIKKFEPRVQPTNIIVTINPDQNLIQIKLFCVLTLKLNTQLIVDLNLPLGSSVTSVPPRQPAA
jgi:phage baseplate assembly protein W